MTTAPSTTGAPDWPWRTYTSAAEAGPAGDRRTAWSWALRRRVVLSEADARVLAEFRTGIRPVDRWPELFRPAGGEPVAADGTTLLDLFLAVHRQLLCGLLTETVRLSPAEIGDLRLGARPYAPPLGGGHRSVTGALRLRDLGRIRSRRRGGALSGCRLDDGHIALLTGAGAAREAYVHGRTAPLTLLPTSAVLRRMIDMPDHFFGTRRGDVPYQSVYRHGEELVAGRRRDLYARLELLRRDDLAGRAVLDLGCNIGMNCYLAVELGARRATGVDDTRLASVAARLNAFYDLPCQFVAADLNSEVPGLGRHDTAFVFAVLGHLGSIDGLLRTIRGSGVRTVYVETHRVGEDQGELDSFLRAPLFASVEFVGRSPDRYDDVSTARGMYRCGVRDAA